MFPTNTNPHDWFKFSDKVNDCLIKFKIKTGDYNLDLKNLRDYAKCVGKGLQSRFDGKIQAAIGYEKAADQHCENLPIKLREHCWL
jgi:hypothetical protein